MRNCIGILTSGGDSQGMNAAVRGVVRSANSHGVQVFGILDGFSGIARENGTLVRELCWSDVSGILQRGGTILGTARCPAMFGREGRKRAALNLARLGITNLIIIGGDGSLTGAEVLKSEYETFCGELRREGLLQETEGTVPLSILGLIGSIDNDMADFEMTIGADSALHRVVECIDAISDTAESHGRTFVIEVMGRNCGWLALAAALATDATFLFIPEVPVGIDWRESLTKAVKKARGDCLRSSLVIMCEGAINCHGERIFSQEVCEVLIGAGFETRLTVLGHVQRGGNASAYDRLMSTLLGVAAVEEFVVKVNSKECKSQILGVRGSSIEIRSLTDMVDRVKRIAAFSKAKKYEEVLAGRSPAFLQMWLNYSRCSIVNCKSTSEARESRESRGQHVLLVLLLGTGSPCIEFVASAAVQFALSLGYCVKVALGGFSGLILNRCISFSSLESYQRQRKSRFFWSSPFVPKLSDDTSCEKIVEFFLRVHIGGVLIAGGKDGVLGLQLLYELSQKHSEIRVPSVLIPACVFNNLAFTKNSIGHDTAINNIIASVDKLKSLNVSQKAYFVEIGRLEGNLLILSAGIASGAEFVVFPNAEFRLENIVSISQLLIERFNNAKSVVETNDASIRGPCISVGLFSEKDENYVSVEQTTKLITGELEPHQTVQKVILGDTIMGGSPSPRDRILSKRFAAFAIDYLVQQVNAGNRIFCVIGEGNMGELVSEPFTELSLGPALFEDYDKWLDAAVQTSGDLFTLNK